MSLLKNNPFDLISDSINCQLFDEFKDLLDGVFEILLKLNADVLDYFFDEVEEGPRIELSFVLVGGEDVGR